MRNIFLLYITVFCLASCKDPEFSLDEPLELPERSAIYTYGQNNFLYALDPETGERIWEKFFGINKILQEPVVLKQYALVNTPLGIVRLDASSGRLVDTIRTVEFDGANHTIVGLICGSAEMLYFGTGDSYLVGYNLETKTVVWRTQYGSSTAFNSTGSIFGNLLIANFNNNLTAVNKSAGDVSWQYTLPGPAVNDPVVAAPFIYVLEKNGILHALDLETGLELWTFATGTTTQTSPVVYGGNIIYGADDNKLYCIDPIAKAPRWVFETSERIQGSAYGYEQSVYFGSFDNYVYCVNIIDGELRWRYRTGALVKSSPIVSRGTMYIGGYDQHMYAFDTSGSLRWKFKVNAPMDNSPVGNYLDNMPVYPAVSGLSSQ